MVTELSGVQFGLKSYAWFQNRVRVRFEIIGMITEQSCTTRSSIATLLALIWKRAILFYFRFWCIVPVVENNGAGKASHLLCKTVMWQITKERAVQFLVAWINDGRPNSRLFISRYLTFLLRHGPLFYILATASALDKVALAEGGAVRLANSTFGSSIWLWVVPLSLSL